MRGFQITLFALPFASLFSGGYCREGEGDRGVREVGSKGDGVPIEIVVAERPDSQNLRDFDGSDFALWVCLSIEATAIFSGVSGALPARHRLHRRSGVF